MRALGLATGIVCAADATSAAAPGAVDTLQCAKVPPWTWGSPGAPEEAWGVWVILDMIEGTSGMPGTAKPLLIPVAQAFVGRFGGAQFLPRIGTEVYVRFIGDNPDHPVIIGCGHTSGYPYPYPPAKADHSLLPGDDADIPFETIVPTESDEGDDSDSEEGDSEEGDSEEGDSEEGGGEGGNSEDGKSGDSDDSEGGDDPTLMEATEMVAKLIEKQSAGDVEDALPAESDADTEMKPLGGTAQTLEVTADGWQITALTGQDRRNVILFDDGYPRIVLKTEGNGVTFAARDLQVNVRGAMTHVADTVNRAVVGSNTLWCVGSHYTRIDGAQTVTRKSVSLTVTLKGSLTVRYGETTHLWGGVRLDYVENDKWTLAKDDMTALGIGVVYLAPAMKDAHETWMRLAVMRTTKAKTQSRTAKTVLRLAAKDTQTVDEIDRTVKVALQLAQTVNHTADSGTFMGAAQVEIVSGKVVQ